MDNNAIRRFGTHESMIFKILNGMAGMHPMPSNISNRCPAINQSVSIKDICQRFSAAVMSKNIHSISCDAGGTRAIIKSITIALVFPPEVRYEEEDVAIRATRLAMTSPAERIPMLPQYDNRTSTVGKKLIQKERKICTISYRYRTKWAPDFLHYLSR